MRYIPTSVEQRLFCNIQDWHNWNSNYSQANVYVCRPRNIVELVAAVKIAEVAGHSIHAIGSSWSLSNVAAPSEVAIDLSELTDNALIVNTTRRSVWTNTDTILKPPISTPIPADHALMLVMGGAKLHQINDDLWSLGWSFMTLGGSQGQAIAGAVSTATHGGDNDFSSVADAVHAIHLVGPGGKEFWIERSPPFDVTDEAKLKTSYFAWHPSIEIIRDDDVFYSALVSVGRFGVIFSMIVEVQPSFNIEQAVKWESWNPETGYQCVEQQLREVAATNSWDVPIVSGPSPLPDGSKEGTRFLEVLYDPYGNAAFVKRRWSLPHNSPLKLIKVPTDATDLAGLQAGQFLGFLGSFSGIASDLFAQQHRAAFSKTATLGAASMWAIGGSAQNQALHRDWSFYIMTGRLPAGTTYEAAYDKFWVSGPFVDSMEFFFDAFASTYIDFVNEVHRSWWKIAGGYISLRFSRTQASAKLAMQRFENTVAVELAVIKGFAHSQGTYDTLLALGKKYGAIAHWGQSNIMTAPEVQAHYGADVSQWRKVLLRLSKEGNINTFSNAFSREKGLEYGPGIMMSHNSRIRCWLGWNAQRTSTFHSKVLPNGSTLAFGPDSLQFKKGQSNGLVIRHDGGVIQAHRGSLQNAPTAGNLVIKRDGRIMAVIQPGLPSGNLYYSQYQLLPAWLW